MFTDFRGVPPNPCVPPQDDPRSTGRKKVFRPVRPATLNLETVSPSSRSRCARGLRSATGCPPSGADCGATGGVPNCSHQGASVALPPCFPRFLEAMVSPDPAVFVRPFKVPVAAGPRILQRGKPIGCPSKSMPMVRSTSIPKARARARRKKPSCRPHRRVLSTDDAPPRAEARRPHRQVEPAANHKEGSRRDIAAVSPAA